MNLELTAISIAELAWRVALRFDAGDWLALVAPTASSVQPTAHDLHEELRAQEIPVVSSQHPSSAAALIASAQEQPRHVLLLSEIDDLAAQEWRSLDLRRDELQRGACVIAVLQRPTLQRILSAAPNLASWISGSLWRVAPLGEQLPAEEVSQRLAALRQRFGMSDDQVLRQAQEHQLPRDPEFGEWLILLDRGDLL